LPVHVLTEIGPVPIAVPPDRDGSFEPVIVRKRQRRPDGIDRVVLSSTARGLTTAEIAAHLEEVYGAKVSKDTISRITDQVPEEIAGWRNRPMYVVVEVSVHGGNGTSSVCGPATAVRARNSGGSTPSTPSPSPWKAVTN
jgi:hypothetical protein